MQWNLLPCLQWELVFLKSEERENNTPGRTGMAKVIQGVFPKFFFVKLIKFCFTEIFLRFFFSIVVCCNQYSLNFLQIFFC